MRSPPGTLNIPLFDSSSSPSSSRISEGEGDQGIYNK